MEKEAVPEMFRDPLLPVAQRVFWWGQPEEWLGDTNRFVAENMTNSDNDTPNKSMESNRCHASRQEKGFAQGAKLKVENREQGMVTKLVKIGPIRVKVFLRISAFGFRMRVHLRPSVVKISLE